MQSKKMEVSLSGQNTERKYAVLGRPIAHSLSPIIHNALFGHFGIKARYEKILVEEHQDLHSILLGLEGANLTLPFKEEGLGLCDEVEEIAKEIGAINTIIKRQNKLLGYNTDVLGFWECVRGLEFENALILGAGGSAKAVAFALKKHKIPTTIYNRTPKRLESFANQGFEIAQTLCSQKFDLIINATSASLYDTLPIEVEVFKALGAKYAFDLVYASSAKIENLQDFREFLLERPKTTFCHLATQFGLEAYDGLEMLLFQALFAFEKFCDYSFLETKGLFYNSTT